MSAAAASAIPRAALLAAGCAVLISLFGAVVGRVDGPVAVDPPPSPVVMARDLRFADRPDGGVLVTNAGTGAVVTIVPPGTNGFLRGLLRGLTRERKQAEPGHAALDPAPFRLTAYQDGRLTLEDSETHRLVDLEAFGPTNAGVFARFLRSTAP